MVRFVTKERLDQLSETGKHQGVIAVAAAYEYAEVVPVIPRGGIFCRGVGFRIFSPAIHLLLLLRKPFLQRRHNPGLGAGTHIFYGDMVQDVRGTVHGAGSGAGAGRDFGGGPGEAVRLPLILNFPERTEDGR